MGPHVKTKSHDEQCRHDPEHIHLRNSPRKNEIIRFLLDQFLEHLSETSEIDSGNSDAHDKDREYHQDILDNGHPGRSSDPTRVDKSAGQNKRNPDGDSRMDSSITGHLDDQPQAFELKLEVGNDADNSNQSHENTQIAAVIPFDEKIRLSVESVAFSDFP